MGESDGPTKLSVAKGQDFHVELQSYPGSGALWSWVPSSDGPRLVSETTHAQDESIGSGALQVFAFQAEAPGTHTLVFELKRPWESSSRSRKEITVEVS
jgi:predicted secreted protein